MRDFTVKQGVMGYIVTIGCQVAGFSNKEDLLKAITEYVNDPEATEKKYYQPKSGWDAQIDVDSVGIRLSNANANTTAFGKR
jgi:hypothetical protein